MESVGRYLVSVTAAAIISSVIEKLIPKSGAGGAVIKMMCGIFMVLTAVSPWLKVQVYDLEAYARSFSEQAQAASDMGKDAAQEYRQSIIKEQVGTYILDKAATLDLDIAVKVTLDGQDAPCGVEISGAVPEEERLIMEQFLEEELGIGRSEQIWTG